MTCIIIYYYYISIYHGNHIIKSSRSSSSNFLGHSLNLMIQPSTALPNNMQLCCKLENIPYFKIRHLWFNLLTTKWMTKIPSTCDQGKDFKPFHWCIKPQARKPLKARRRHQPSLANAPVWQPFVPPGSLCWLPSCGSASLPPFYWSCCSPLSLSEALLSHAPVSQQAALRPQLHGTGKKFNRLGSLKCYIALGQITEEN